MSPLIHSHIIGSTAFENDRSNRVTPLPKLPLILIVKAKSFNVSYKSLHDLMPAHLSNLVIHHLFTSPQSCQPSLIMGPKGTSFFLIQDHHRYSFYPMFGGFSSPFSTPSQVYTHTYFILVSSSFRSHLNVSFLQSIIFMESFPYQFQVKIRPSQSILYFSFLSQMQL